MQKKIAITGGIGSGKSLATKWIAEMGYPTFSCDEINRNLWDDPAYIAQIKSLFPNCIRGDKIDKNALKNTVFSNASALEKLNAIAHPMIMKRLFSAMEKSASELVFAEVPLLFEGNYEGQFDEIIVITRDVSERINAVKQRDGLSEEEIKNRMAAQFDYNRLEKRIENVNAHVIQNEGDTLSLKDKLQRLIARL